MQLLLPSNVVEEGLTHALLNEYLHRLELRRSRVLYELYSNAALHYSSQDIATDNEGVDEEVNSIIATVPDNRLAKMASEHRRLSTKLAETTRCIVSTRAATDLQARLAQFDADVASGSYSSAAWSARQVDREAAQIVADAMENSAAIDDDIAALHAAFADRRNSLQQAMYEAAEQSARGDAASGMLWVARCCGPARAPLAEVLQALAAFGNRASRLEAYARMLLNEALLPMIANPLDVQPFVEEGEEYVTLTWRGNTANKGATLEQSLLAVLAFASGEMLADDTEAVAETGSILWPRLSAAYLEARLSQVKPADGPAGERFQKAAAAATAFEDEAARSGWVPGVGCRARNAKKGRIHSYVKHALNRYLHAKRLRVVQEAQRVMSVEMGHDSHPAGCSLPGDEARLDAACAAFVDASQRFQEPRVSSQVTGEAGPGMIRSSFADASRQFCEDGDMASIDLYAGGGTTSLEYLTLGVYQVGHRGAALVALVQQVAEEVQASASTAVANLMAGAVRDIATLAARPPITNDGEYDQFQVPTVAALLHNDAWHLSIGLASVEHAFPLPSLDPADSAASSSMAGVALPGAGRGLDFSCEAGLLRGVASRVLSDMIRRQDVVLCDILSQAEGLVQVHVPARRITASKVVAQLLASLKRGVAVLGGVLPPAAHVCLAAALLQALSTRIIGQVLAMRDIGVEESEELPQILHALVDDSPEAAIGRRAEQSRALIQAVRDAAPALLQLQVLLEILNARLADIRDWWSSGALQMRGFQAEQTAHLIRALFDHTDLRSQVLAEIEG